MLRRMPSGRIISVLLWFVSLTNLLLLPGALSFFLSTGTVVERELWSIVQFYFILLLWMGIVQKWHPDKRKDPGETTIRFQEINEAYQGKCYCLFIISLNFLVFKFLRNSRAFSVVCFYGLDYEGYSGYKWWGFWGCFWICSFF